MGSGDVGQGGMHKHRGLQDVPGPSGGARTIGTVAQGIYRHFCLYVSPWVAGMPVKEFPALWVGWGS